jgi:hypothetical protein
MSEPTPSGYYSEVGLLDDPPTDIFFRQIDGAPPPPEELRQLKTDIEDTVQVALSFLTNRDKVKIKVMDRLRLAAQVGCCGPQFNVAEGRSSLESTRKLLLGEGYELRKELLDIYIKYMLIVLVPTLLLGALCYVASTKGIYLPAPPDPDPGKKGFPHLSVVAISAFWIPAGAVFGVWAEFTFRTGTLVYDRLLYFDPERWLPRQRFIIAILVAYMLAFILALGIVQIGLFGVLLNDFASTRPEVSGAVGWVAGFSYPYVRDILNTLRPATRQ